MTLDLTDEEVNLLLRALGELPAKVSYSLLGKIGEQAAAENRRRQEAAVVQPPADAAVN
jgi:hypothetical protein